MRNPIHVLKSLEEKASVSNYKYERLYRNLYNPEFYLLAYANIAKSQGSMTQGVDGQTLDNMSLPRINRIIESIRNRTYQPKPAKRKYIPKKNGKLRPLGITSTDDKLVQEVVRMILEAIYEPTFSNNSHGFRPKRSCHTALTQVKKNFTGVTWIVEGDIKACFDNFDHHVLVELLRKRISDEAFIGLIWKLVTTLIANTKGEGKAGDDFWVKAETLLYCALIGYIHYEAPVEEQNFSTLIEFINAMEVREDDEEFKNPVDLMFDALEAEKPNHFAVRQYKKYKLAAGDICSK